MNDNLLNILKHRELPINNEQLIAYLTNKLSDDDAHAVEEQLAANEIDSDMLEGLQYVKDSSRIAGYTFELDQLLRKKLNTGRPKRTGIAQPNLWWWIGGVILLLALAVVAFYFIRYTSG